MESLPSNEDFSKNLIYYLAITGCADSAGILIAFGISLTISIKRRWFWVNAVLVLLLAWLLNKFNLLGWTYAKPFFWFIGGPFHNTALEFIINGSILLTIALLIFLLPQTNRFIEKGLMG